MLRRQGARVDDHEVLEPGTRVRLSALGKMRCPKMTRQTGVVVAVVPHSDFVRVLMDGNKDPSTLHRICRSGVSAVFTPFPL